MTKERWEQMNDTLFLVVVEGFLVYGTAMELIENPGWLFTYPYLLLMLLAGVKICIQGNGWKEWIFTIGMGIVAYLSYQGSGDRAVLPMALGICCTKNVNLRRLLKWDLFLRILSAALFLLLPFAGALPNHIGVEVGGRARTFFGWYHPNGMGKSFLLICMEWMYFRHGRFRWYDYAGFAGVIVFLDLTANSRTSEILIACLLLLEIVSEAAKRYGKSVCDLWALITAAAFSASFLLAALSEKVYDRNMEFFLEKTGTIGTRMLQVWRYVHVHGPSLFGRPYTPDTDEYLDMLFASVGLMRGLVFGGIVAVLSVTAVYYGWKKKKETFLLLLFVLFAYGMMECEHFNLIYGFFPVLLGIPVYNWKRTSAEQKL